jgi:hypothetical protein
VVYGRGRELVSDLELLPVGQTTVTLTSFQGASTPGGTVAVEVGLLGKIWTLILLDFVLVSKIGGRLVKARLLNNRDDLPRMCAAST